MGGCKKVRKEMKAIGIDKDPGSSLLDIEGCLLDG
jgi:hypothetical protein